MLVNVRKRERVETIKKLIPGVYEGTWSGYTITVPIRDRFTYILTVNEGVRGINIAVTVTIDDNGEVTVTLKGK